MPVLNRFARLRITVSRGARVALVLMLLVHVPLEQPAAETQSKLTQEYDLKAAFLFNFTQFAEWPAAAIPAEETPWVIGLLGADPFGKSIDEIVANETVRDHPIVVQRYREVEDITTCHILYLSESETSRMKPILASLVDRSILTVGDADGFTEAGGMIRFHLVQNKVRLKINLEAVEAAGLAISSKLLRQAQTTSSDQEP